MHIRFRPTGSFRTFGESACDAYVVLRQFETCPTRHVAFEPFASLALHLVGRYAKAENAAFTAGWKSLSLSESGLKG